MSRKILILLIIVAVDIFAAFAWLFYSETPTAVMSEMRRRMAATQTVVFDIRVKAAGSVEFPLSSKVETGTLKQTALLSLDLRDLGAPKKDASFSLEWTSASSTVKNIAGDFLAREEQRFLHLTTLPGESALVSTFRDTWVVLPENFVDIPFLRADKNIVLDEVAQKKLRDLFRRTKFITALEDLPEARLVGERQYHYRVRFHPEAAEAFTILATNIAEHRSLDAAELRALSTDLQSTQVHEMEVWIRKRDFFLSQLSLKGVSASAEKSTELPFSLTITLKQWNEPLTIRQPQTPRSLKSILDALGEAGLRASGERETTSTLALPDRFLTSLQTATSTFEVGSEDGDADGLIDVLEAFYRTDPLSPDSDGDGYQDGYEVNQGFNPTGPGALFAFGR